MRFYYFRFMDDCVQAQTRYLGLFDYISAVNCTLEILNKHIPAINLSCLDCTIINGIVFVDLEKEFDVLCDDNKIITVASLVRTFRELDVADYIVIYADGELVKLQCASNMYLTPIDTKNEITPLELKEYILEYDNLINVDDDVALPMLMWVNTKEHIAIPTVRSVPFVDSYNNSVIIEMFSDKEYGYHPFMTREKLLNTPVYSNGCLYIEVANYSGNTINTDVILKTLRQYLSDVNIVLRNYQTMAYGTKQEETVYSQYIDGDGILIDYYKPEGAGFVPSQVGVRIQNKNIIYSVADYCLTNAIRLYGEQNGKLLYDAWVAGDTVCVSITDNLVNLIQKLKPNEQRSVIYSLVNTLCKNFFVSSVMILLDGYTLRNIGVINTERPINYI